MVGSHEDTFELSEDEISRKLAATIAEAFQRGYLKDLTTHEVYEIKVD
jgi:hypothetical protein